MVTRLPILILVVALFLLGLLDAKFARAADDDRTRRAKAALAIAQAEADAVRTRPRPIAVAPAPRPVVPKDYAAGYRSATREQIPLVVYVGCDGPKIEGAATAKVNSYPDVEAPAVVVGYPSGDRLFRDAVLPATASPAQVQKAADAAGRKIPEPMPKSKPAVPSPVNNWIIRGPAASPACDT